jgi:hypothetical protein
MKMILAVAAGVLGYCYYRGHTAKSTKALVKEDIRRWEDEGGNVPAVATPSPAPVSRSSVPTDIPSHRH